jgi:nitrate reductase gamma subunit
MRKVNWRVAAVGLVLIVLAAGFFLAMSGMARQSNDPVALMQTVGMVSGGVGGLGTVMAIIGLIGRRSRDSA